MPVHDIKCKCCSEITTRYIHLPMENAIKCVRCGSPDTTIYYGDFPTKVFCGINYVKGMDGKSLSTKEIDRKCKEEGLVYASNSDIDREARNNRDNNKKESDKRDQVLVDKISNEFKKRGV